MTLLGYRPEPRSRATASPSVIRGSFDSGNILNTFARLSKAGLTVDDSGRAMYKGRSLENAAREAGKSKDRLIGDILGVDLGAAEPRQSARALAALGRGGDTEIAHLTPGELVLQPDHLNPATLAMIRRDLGRHGIALDHVRVGSQKARRNPKTGAQQFTDQETDTELLPVTDTPRREDQQFEIVWAGSDAPTFWRMGADQFDIKPVARRR